MFIRCKKTGEEYEITDREIGEKVECPCCGEKFVVDDALLPENIYEAALIRKSEAIALRDEPVYALYKHGSEGKYAKLFDYAYENNDVEAQFQLARWLYDCEQEYSLATYWFGQAAKRKHAEATKRLEECHKHGFGVKQDENCETVRNHISDLLEWQRYQRSDAAGQDIITWREVIEMNCPVCESDIKLSTKLMGGKVRCPHCKGVFMAKGEGIMSTSERRRHRFESRFEEEAKLTRTRFLSCRSAVALLQQKLGIDNFVVVGLGDGVGYGSHSPWMGVYLSIEWCDKRGVRPCLDEIRGMVESVLGFWVRLSLRQSRSGIVRILVYIRHDRPCEQNAAFKREMGGASLVLDGQEEAEHPLVVSRQAEKERLDYLLNGDVDDVESTKNAFIFSSYLCNKFPVNGLSVPNFPPDEPRCVALGLNDGFGIVVRASKILTNEMFSAVVRDLEKRCSRTMKFVKMTSGNGEFRYSFLPMISSQCAAVSRQTSVRSSSKPYQFSKQKQERILPMKRTATTFVPQHLGKGTRVDWSRENKVFSEMLAKHGIGKFHVEMANPCCAEVSIPMTEDEDVVRDFANDLFHALDILDEGCDLEFGQLTDCSGIDINEDAKCYYVLFNQHDVAECNPRDGKYKYKIEAITANGADDEDDDSDEPADGELTPEQIMKYIADGIKSGAIRSKSGEGYFVLKGEYYDAIEAGRKTTEYRDLTPRNLAKSIGIKTVKFQRGYGHPGQSPRQMRFEVSSVGLMDASDRECDPYAIPPNFLATTIAIHLGKRMG